MEKADTVTSEGLASGLAPVAKSSCKKPQAFQFKCTKLIYSDFIAQELTEPLTLSSAVGLPLPPPPLSFPLLFLFPIGWFLPLVPCYTEINLLLMWFTVLLEKLVYLQKPL